MEAKVIITRTAVKKGSMISTGRIYDGKSFTKLSTDILTSVKISYRSDDFIVYNATDKNGNKYNIIELKHRAVVTAQEINNTNDEITGIGYDPIKEIISPAVSIHPTDNKLLSCDFLTYSISDVTTIKGNHITVISIFA